MFQPDGSRLPYCHTIIKKRRRAYGLVRPGLWFLAVPKQQSLVTLSHDRGVVSFVVSLRLLHIGGHVLSAFPLVISILCRPVSPTFSQLASLSHFTYLF